VFFEEYMQESSQNTAMAKLKMDTRRFCSDFSLRGRFAELKLLFVVDFWPVAYYRLMEFCNEKGGLFRSLLQFFLIPLKPFVQGFSGTRISPASIIAGGLLFHNSPGVVISAGSVFGENCTVFSGACVVLKANDKGSAAPKIGNNVRLMAGCKIIGDVTIGDDVWVGANAVVTKSIPGNCIAMGIPARWVKRETGKGSSND
jgi:serine O-acetyltransferase